MLRNRVDWKSVAVRGQVVGLAIVRNTDGSAERNDQDIIRVKNVS